MSCVWTILTIIWTQTAELEKMINFTSRQYLTSSDCYDTIRNNAIRLSPTSTQPSSPGLGGSLSVSVSLSTDNWYWSWIGPEPASHQHHQTIRCIDIQSWRYPSECRNEFNKTMGTFRLEVLTRIILSANIRWDCNRYKTLFIIIKHIQPLLPPHCTLRVSPRLPMKRSI